MMNDEEIEGIDPLNENWHVCFIEIFLLK
jgi:hypothetical protein